MSRNNPIGLAAVMLGALACGPQETPIEGTPPPVTDLPAPPGEEGPPPVPGEEGPPPGPGEEGPPPEPDGANSIENLPASYRIDCMDIQRLGDADNTVFQVATLQNTWNRDVAEFRLNILIDILDLDGAANTGAVTIRSGIGRSLDDQCAQAETSSSEFTVAYQPNVTEWAPADAPGSCASASASGGAGSFSLDLGAEDRVFIYAEDDQGTVLNCSLEPAVPDAIPILGLSATISSTADGRALAGTLTGCMTEVAARNTCSCMSACVGNQHPDCPGCPGGALPLGALLGAIATTPHCTDLLGEPAFDVVIEFSARRLADVPQTC